VDLAAEPALDRDGRDAGHALEALGQVVLGNLAQADAIVVALEADAHDRRGTGVELEHDRRIGLLREPPAHAIEPVADVVSRFVEVRAPGEVQRDARRAFRRGRLETFEPGDRAERLLDGGSRALHLERPTPE
jgi:hypothetical protein